MKRVLRANPRTSRYLAIVGTVLLTWQPLSHAVITAVTR